MRELPAIPRRRRGSGRVGRYVLALVTLILLADVLVGEAGLIARFRASGERARLEAEVDTLRRQNDALREAVRLLREDPRTIEDIARRDLGMLTPGERLFVIGMGSPSGEASGEADEGREP